MPLPHTVIDFWRMVYEHKCGSIVMLNTWDDGDEVRGGREGAGRGWGERAGRGQGGGGSRAAARHAEVGVANEGTLIFEFSHGTK